MEALYLCQTNLQHLQSNYLSENFSYYGLIVIGIEFATINLQSSISPEGEPGG